MGSLTVRRLVVAGAASALVFTGAPAAFAVDDDGGRATATQEAGKEDSGAVERNSGLKIDLEKRFGYKPYTGEGSDKVNEKNIDVIARDFHELWDPARQGDMSREEFQDMSDVDVQAYLDMEKKLRGKDNSFLKGLPDDSRGNPGDMRARMLAAALQWSYEASNLRVSGRGSDIREGLSFYRTFGEHDAGNGDDWTGYISYLEDGKEAPGGRKRALKGDKDFLGDETSGLPALVVLNSGFPASDRGSLADTSNFYEVWEKVFVPSENIISNRDPVWVNFTGRGDKVPGKNEHGKFVGPYAKKAAWAVAVDFDPSLVNQDPEKVLSGAESGERDQMARAVQALVGKLADGVDNDDPDAMLKQREGTNFVYPTGRLDQSIKNTRKALDEDPMSDEARESLESYVEAMEKLKEAAEAGEMDVLPADGDGVSEVKRTSEDSSGPMEAADSDADESDADEDRGSDDSDSTETSTPASTTTSAPAEDDEDEAEEEASTSTPAAPPASETSTSETSTTEAPPADEAEETTSSAPSEGRDIPDADKAGTDAGGDGFDLSGLEIDAAELVSEVKPNTVAPQVGDKYETTTNSAWRLKPFRTKDQTDAKIALTMQKVQEANPGKSPEEVNDLASQAVKDNLRSYKVGFVEDISPGHSNKGDVLEVVAFLQPATEQEKAASGSDWHQTDSYTDKSMYVLVKWSGGDSEDANRNDYYYALHANFAYDNDDVVRRIP